MQGAGSIQKREPEIRLVYPPSLCKLRSSSKPTNQNVTQLYLQIQTALSLSVTIQNLTRANFYLTMIDNVTSQNTDLTF
jgi:hypothetical protein